jgi:hypothetical protein
VGPIRVKKSDMKTPDLLVAKLSGARNETVATVKLGKKYFFVTEDGKAREVPADSHTDCLNYSVWEMNQEIKKRKRK